MNQHQNEKEEYIVHFEHILDHRFKNIKLLRTALTHSSYCYEHDMDYCDNNERLEFLGDAVLDTVIAGVLYDRMPESEEGDLSKMKSEIVCEEALLRKADEIKLYDHLFLGRGEIKLGPHGRSRAILADAMEAVIGAVFIDAGWNKVTEVVKRLFSDIIEDSIEGKLSSDYKSELQICMQNDGKPHTIKYKTDLIEGPPHDRCFTISVICDGNKLGQGKGTSKKQAEQKAAREALAAIRSQN